MSDYKRKLSNCYDEPPHYEEDSGRSTPTLSEDLVAAEALTQLTKSTSAPSTPLSNLSIEDSQHPLVTKVNQVSKHPLVTGAFKYYADSKRNYPHFNYAAELVERATLPVMAKIEDGLNYRHIQRKKKRKIKGNKVETRKRLQFCLHILRLANDQINSQVRGLQQKMNERETMQPEQQGNYSLFMLQTPTPTESASYDTAVNTPQTPSSQPSEQVPENQTSLETQQTKTEIITTVKKIIHVISNFKASSLTVDSVANESSELKSTIRDIILKLPSQIQQTANSNNLTSQETNDKIFLFAKESLDMIQRLTVVFNDQLQKVEDWFETGTKSDDFDSQIQGAESNGSVTPEVNIDNKIQF